MVRAYFKVGRHLKFRVLAALPEHCTEILDAVDLAVTPESEGLPEDRLDDPPADNPVLFDIPIYEAFIRNVWDGLTGLGSGAGPEQ